MYKNKQVYAVVLAAGKGTRIGFDKMLYKLDRYEVAHHSISKFQENEFVDCIIVAAGENYDEIKQIAAFFKSENSGKRRCNPRIKCAECTGSY